jgi:DNA-binding transcriptional LysR family regulator
LITLKQLEALQCVVQLGTFERAAMRLNTTQSAISKRIQQLEEASGLPIFDRNQRGARLTEKGEHLLALGQKMLALQGQMLDLKSGGELPAQKLRLGVTQLSAVTWLPRLIEALREYYPSVEIEPEVDMSRNLYDRLVEGSMDLIVAPEIEGSAGIKSLRVAEVKNVWMARPGLVKTNRTLTLEQLALYPIVAQGRKSGSWVYLDKWLRAQGAVFSRVLSSDSLTAVVGLAAAGLGVTFLPEECYRPLIKEKKLVVIRTKPSLPAVPYAAMYRADRPSAFLSGVAELTRECTDFSCQLQR